MNMEKLKRSFGKNLNKNFQKNPKTYTRLNWYIGKNMQSVANIDERFHQDISREDFYLGMEKDSKTSIEGNSLQPWSQEAMEELTVSRIYSSWGWRR